VSRPKWCSTAFPLSRGAAPEGEPVRHARAWCVRPGSFWLDSADALGGERAWSFLGVEADRLLSYRAGSAVREDASGPRPLGDGGFLSFLERELKSEAALADARSLVAPPFGGGWFGLLAYDLGREFDRLPARAADDLAFPEMWLSFHTTVLAFDHASGNWWAIGLVPAEESARDRERLVRQRVEHLLANLPRPERTSPASPAVAVPSANFSAAAYEASVARALDYIAAGDIYQVNLSQRFESPWPGSACALYEALRRESPARYGVFARLAGGRAVCSISPELFLSVRGREIVTRPIKGTRPRGRTREEDGALQRELRASTKDRAELTMIVDLERNDLGRVCEYGTVRVASPGDLEAHPTVFHRVAAVTGTLRAQAGLADVLRATFPGGSVTGAPKIRAMEIIEELEPVRRGPYCGALGWIGADGDLELNLAIRTALVDETAGRVWYQAGGGIVADSDPAAEYQESLAKAAAFFRAAAPPGTAAPFAVQDPRATLGKGGA
jgi:para-aminobenzoate synthetase component 1